MPPDRDLELALMRLAWRVDALDKWREETVTPELALLDQRCDKLEGADEIAEAVAAAIREDPPTAQTMVAGLATWQKWGALITGALLMADAVKGLWT